MIGKHLYLFLWLIDLVRPIINIVKIKFATSLSTVPRQVVLKLHSIKPIVLNIILAMALSQAEAVSWSPAIISLHTDIFRNSKRTYRAFVYKIKVNQYLWDSDHFFSPNLSPLLWFVILTRSLLWRYYFFHQKIFSQKII
jgi:hypothetical protein